MSRLEDNLLTQIHVLKFSNSELQNEQLEMSNKLRSATGGKDSDMNAYVDLMDSLQTSK